MHNKYSHLDDGFMIKTEYNIDFKPSNVNAINEKVCRNVFMEQMLITF